MDKEFIDEMCNYIKQILRSGGPILWSWGVENFRHIEYKEMAALRFKVNGFLHKADVVVAFNEGADCFEVYCLNENDEVVKSKDDVYLQELVDVVDQFVEKDCSQKEYNAQLEEWSKH